MSVETHSKISKVWAVLPNTLLDYSFKDMPNLEEIVDEEPRLPLKKSTPTITLIPKSIKLSNNRISNMRSLFKVMSNLVEQPEEITWIDLSFNELVTIDEVLLRFPKLSSLYLHANSIKNISEVDKLAKLTNLRTLTLHGNPINTTTTTSPSFKNPHIGGGGGKGSKGKGGDLNSSNGGNIDKKRGDGSSGANDGNGKDGKDGEGNLNNSKGGEGGISGGGGNGNNNNNKSSSTTSSSNNGSGGGNSAQTSSAGSKNYSSESPYYYRYYVIAKIPQLRHLDFCAITKQDRVTAKNVTVQKI